MSIRSQGLRLAKALTGELQRTSQRCVSTAWRQHRPLYCNSSTASLTTRPSCLTLAQNFSTKQPSDGESPHANDGATATKDASTTKEEEEVGAEEGVTPDVDGGSGGEEDPKITHLEFQIKDLKDNLLRSLAEQENTRRIAARDVANARSFAISSFAKSLLDTSDNLSRALEAVPLEMRNDRVNHPILANLYEGITMTEDGLNKAFSKNGLTKFGTIGDKFDPNLHMALFEYPDPAGSPGHVGQVMKVGFMLNDRVLRSAEVGVVKAS